MRKPILSIFLGAAAWFVPGLGHIWLGPNLQRTPAGSKLRVENSSLGTNMKTKLCAASFAVFTIATGTIGSAAEPYHLLKEIPIGGAARWDYASVDEAARRLYVSHGTEVVVIDIDKDAVVGVISNTPGVHGLAPAPDLGRGFVSCGGENKAAIVDLKTLAILSKVPTGQNPDGMLYEPGQHEVYMFNGRGQSATVIDAKDGKVIATIPLGGKPEFPQADPSMHRVFDNLEDKSEVVAIDTKTDAAKNDQSNAKQGGNAFFVQ